MMEWVDRSEAQFRYLVGACSDPVSDAGAAATAASIVDCLVGRMHLLDRTDEDLAAYLEVDGAGGRIFAGIGTEHDREKGTLSGCEVDLVSLGEFADGLDAQGLSDAAYSSSLRQVREMYGEAFEACLERVLTVHERRALGLRVVTFGSNPGEVLREQVLAPAP